MMAVAASSRMSIRPLVSWWVSPTTFEIARISGSSDPGRRSRSSRYRSKSPVALGVAPPALRSLLGNHAGDSILGALSDLLLVWIRYGDDVVQVTRPRMNADGFDVRTVKLDHLDEQHSQLLCPVA